MDDPIPRDVRELEEIVVEQRAHADARLRRLDAIIERKLWPGSERYMDLVERMAVESGRRQAVELEQAIGAMICARLPRLGPWLCDHPKAAHIFFR